MKINDVLLEFAPAGSGGGNTPRGPRTPGGDDGSGDDPYSRPEPEYYSRSIDFFGRFEADHFDDEEFDKATGVFKGYWDDEEGRDQIAYFKFDNPAATGSDDPGMGWYYEPQNESVAEGMFGIDDKIKGQIQNIVSDLSDIPGMWDHKAQTFTDAGMDKLKTALKNNPKYIKYALNLDYRDYEAEGVAEGSEELHPDTLELIDEYIAKIEPDADRDELIQSILNNHIHTSELEYALQGVAEGNDDDYGPELDALKKEFGKFTTHYDRMDTDPAYAASYNRQQADRLNRERSDDDLAADTTMDMGQDMAEGKPKEKEADYGPDYQDMVARVKKLAGMGPLKTVYDPQKRVYKNVPTAVQPKK